MAARRLVKTRGDEVSFRVHDAKVALGERGENWRDLMSLVREVAAAPSDQGGAVSLKKGRPVDSHAIGANTPGSRGPAKALKSAARRACPLTAYQ